MNIKDYAIYINNLAEKYPEATMVFARDEEGNGYGHVHYAPAAGLFDGDEWYPLTPDDEEAECRTPKDVTHVLVN
jgi:hypothetical protein